MQPGISNPKPTSKEPPLEGDVGLAPAFELQIEPDFDEIDFTHFRGHLGHVRTLIQLTPEVRDLITPVMDMLVRMRIKKLIYNQKRDPAFLVDGNPLEIPLQDRKRDLRAMQLTAYWIEWHRRRYIMRARARHAQDPTLIQWRCLDCDRKVPLDRLVCFWPECPSWNKIHFVTGEPTLHLVEKQKSAAQAG